MTSAEAISPRPICSFQPALTSSLSASHQNVELVLIGLSFADFLEEPPPEESRTRRGVLRFRSRNRTSHRPSPADRYSGVNSQYSTRVIYGAAPVEEIRGKHKQSNGEIKCFESFEKVSEDVDGARRDTREKARPEPRTSKWESSVDPRTGRPYYCFGRDGRTSTWTMQEGFEPIRSVSVLTMQSSSQMAEHEDVESKIPEDVGSTLCEPSEKPSKRESRTSRWKSAVDPRTGRPYFYCGRDGRISTWTMHEGFEPMRSVSVLSLQSSSQKADHEDAELKVPEGVGSTTSKPSNTSPDGVDKAWKTAVDPLTGLPYYYLGHDGRTSTWTKPGRTSTWTKPGFESKTPKHSFSVMSVTSDKSCSHTTEHESFEILAITEGVDCVSTTTEDTSISTGQESIRSDSISFEGKDMKIQESKELKSSIQADISSTQATAYDVFEVSISEDMGCVTITPEERSTSIGRESTSILGKESRRHDAKQLKSLESSENLPEEIAGPAVTGAVAGADKEASAPTWKYELDPLTGIPYYYVRGCSASTWTAPECFQSPYLLQEEPDDIVSCVTNVGGGMPTSIRGRSECFREDSTRNNEFRMPEPSESSKVTHIYLGEHSKSSRKKRKWVKKLRVRQFSSKLRWRKKRKEPPEQESSSTTSEEDSVFSMGTLESMDAFQRRAEESSDYIKFLESLFLHGVWKMCDAVDFFVLPEHEALEGPRCVANRTCHG